MKKVLKSTEPLALEKYRERFISQFKKWQNVKSNRKTYDAIRDKLFEDQKGLCAYCEMTLHENNRSVEHFIPCNQSTKETNYDLDWSNMLAICLDPGGLIDVDEQQVNLFKSNPCCGKKKDNFVPDSRFLNPLKLPTLPLFRFSSEDGEIKADEVACLRVGLPIENVEFTIATLELNIQRLKDQRLAMIEEIEKDIDELDDGSIDPLDLNRKVAVIHFKDGRQNWPRFFTTIRWILGEGAEQHLKDISYSG